jgi:SpoVK/Ycf46/Vps4 family AAA+-type ATPase
VYEIPFWHAQLLIHVFKLSSEVGQEDLGDGSPDQQENVACHQWILPSVEFQNYWQTLYFDQHIKDSLLNYISTAMIFADCKVDPSLISCNRVVLLHGPPGTGKTTLCKGLAQKLAINLSDRFPYAQLIEINAHSLFSKWFSESGKLIQKLFERIQELVDDQQCLVCLLIDEVESLAAARKGAINGAEPSDAVRSVNALLTQLDKLKRHNNVLIFTTSNITEAIDLAFIDRADIKQYIGVPNLFAR